MTWLDQLQAVPVVAAKTKRTSGGRPGPLPGEPRTLKYITEHGPVSYDQIAGGLGVSRSTAKNHVKELIAQGKVKYAHSVDVGSPCLVKKWKAA